MAYLTFNAGPSSQAGMDAAAGALMERMSAMGGFGGGYQAAAMRRDPQLALAMEAMRTRAASEDADRALRAQLGGQEMDYRNRALDAQVRSGSDDRAAMMERLQAQLLGQRGLATERMSHEQRLAEAAQIATTQEAARARAFQEAQQAAQQKFQGGLSDKQMQHATGLAAMQAAMQTAAQQAEQSGMDARARMDLQGRILGEFASAAASQDPMAWQTVQSRIPEIMAAIGAQGQGGAAYTPPPKPAPKTVAAKLAQEEPELTAAWMSAMMGKDGVTRKNSRNFLLEIPVEDIANNKQALETFLRTQYNETPDDALRDWWAMFPSTMKNIDDRRAAFGLRPYFVKPSQALGLRD